MVGTETGLELLKLFIIKEMSCDTFIKNFRN